MTTVGVLALQGSFAEHLKALVKIPGVLAIQVKNQEDLARVDRLIIPGGESTTIGKLLDRTGLKQPLVERIRQGMPVWGTCAGMILLAKEVVGEEPHLGLMDISVRRNAYGGQLASFRLETEIPSVAPEKIPLVFIRAPWIEAAGKKVEILAQYDGKGIAARQGNLLVTSFHPELTDSIAFYEYFCRIPAA